MRRTSSDNVIDFRKPWLMKCEGMQNAIWHYDLRRFRYEELKRKNLEKLQPNGKPRDA